MKSAEAVEEEEPTEVPHPAELHFPRTAFDLEARN